MTISIDISGYATTIFTALLVALVVFSMRRVRAKDFFSVATTQELKGFAVLGVIFSHIGYFLVSDHSFLFPLTIMAGVCVNIFLFLSGYGLTISSSKKDETVGQFYKNRLLKLMIPFWLVLGIFLVADFFVLGISYSWSMVVPALFGIFTSADIYHDLNSPLWYFTLILFYYVLFPFFFSKKRPWVTAVLLFVASSAVLLAQPAWLGNVIDLYAVHCVAFPLGIVVAWLRTDVRVAGSSWVRRWDTILHGTQSTFKDRVQYYGIIAFLVWCIAYTAIHSGIGSGVIIEQAVSLFTMSALLLLFAFKKVESRLLYLFGLYSYELYLLHWPIMYRYDFLYTRAPGWLATLLYLMLFVAIGWVVRQSVNFLTASNNHHIPSR